MREIKFRAWDKKTKKMRAVNSIVFHYEEECFDFDNSRLPKVVNLWGKDIIEDKAIVLHREIKDVELMQYTGLKDKNGKEIWENDIVCFQFDNDNCTLPYTDTKKRYGKIFFSDYRASFAIAMGRNGSKSMNNDLYKYVQCGNRVEVIGNIFDNPELLEGGAE